MAAHRRGRPVPEAEVAVPFAGSLVAPGERARPPFGRAVGRAVELRLAGQPAPAPARVGGGRAPAHGDGPVEHALQRQLVEPGAVVPVAVVALPPERRVPPLLAPGPGPGVRAPPPLAPLGPGFPGVPGVPAAGGSGLG